MKKKPACHKGPVEVHKNLYCSAEHEAREAIEKQTYDTLVPLLLLPDHYFTGFSGEVLYCPVKDFGVLKEQQLMDLTTAIIDRLNHKKSVLIFCMGGHGRTGYVASVVLGLLGQKDPIGYLHSNYCRFAVESMEQLQQISKVLGKPELIPLYEDSVEDVQRNLLWPDNEFFLHEYHPGIFDTCDDCELYHFPCCQRYGIKMFADEPACEEFVSKNLF